DVALGRGNLDGAWRQEAVTAAVAGGGEVRVRDADDLAAVERDEPLQRAHERGLAPAPALRLGPLDVLADDLGEDGGEQRARLLADEAAHRDGVLALLAGDFFFLQRGGVDAVLRGEALPGLGHAAVGGERGA